MLTNAQIQKMLPHRYPMLLVDKVTNIEGDTIEGIKNVTANEPIFTGHFPGIPIMPGVLIIESLAQLGGILLMSREGNSGKLGVLTGVNNFKFRRQVVPGDTLCLKSELVAFRHGMAKTNVWATVDGELAASGEISFALVDSKE